MWADQLTRGANPLTPFMPFKLADPAYAPVPKVISMPHKAAGSAAAMFPIVLRIAHLPASLAAAPFPSVTEEAKQVHLFCRLVISLSVDTSFSLGRTQTIGACRENLARITPFVSTRFTSTTFE